MAVKLRLQRHGAKKRPFYRIVAADARAPRDGRFLDIVGTYDPNHDPAQLRMKLERVDYWLGNGAQATDTVASLIRRARKSPDSLTPFKVARPARKTASTANNEVPAPAAAEEAPAAAEEAPAAAEETPAAAEEAAAETAEVETDEA